jgi:hypothetical protein
LSGPEPEAPSGDAGGPEDQRLPARAGPAAPGDPGAPSQHLSPLQRRTSILAIDLDRVERDLANAEIAEIEAKRLLDWEKAKLRLRLRDRDSRDGFMFRSSGDIDAEVTVAENEGPLKRFYDSWIKSKAERIGLRSEHRTLDRAHRREVYGTM